ncbi:MAG: Uma2 family endonuclease [Parafilimonas sp.]
MTEAEYIGLDNISNRHEFYNNEGFPVPDHSTNHTLIEINVIELLQNYLQGENAIPFASNLRLYNANKITYTYPDLIVFSEQPAFTEHEVMTVTNPYLVIEIFESSNPDYNSAARFDLYQGIPSFKEFLIIDADSMHVISISDQGEEWLVQEAKNIKEAVRSHAINFTFKITDIYKDIKLSSEIKGN